MASYAPSQSNQEVSLISFYISEEKWRDQRKMLNPAFNISHMSSFIRVFEKQAEILVLKLKAIAPTDSVDILSYLSLCSLDIVCGTYFQNPLNSRSEELARRSRRE